MNDKVHIACRRKYLKEFSSRLAEEKEQKKLWKIQAEIRKLVKEEEKRQTVYTSSSIPAEGSFIHG